MLGGEPQIEDSIDQSDRPTEPVTAQSDFAARARIDGRFREATQLAKLGRAQHERADDRATTSENQIVRSETGELEFRLLDRE